MTDFDILIVGGGMAGSTLACALETTGARVGIIEAVARTASQQPSFDDRVIALSWGSKCIYDNMGLWKSIAPSATPIDKIHISEKGRFGFTHLDADEEEVPALGYVALAKELGSAITTRLNETETTRFCPATLTDFTTDNDQVKATISIDGEMRTVSTRLLVAADGGQSSVREQLGINTRNWEYQQTAIVSNVESGKPHNNVAWERFTPDGPLALLPMTENRFGLVLTVNSSDAEEVLAMDDDNFLELLHQRFGYRCGRFSRVGKRIAYPLALMTANESVRPRVVLAGNAAHALHPISGQGFNLGLRDIAVLVDIIADALKAGEDPGSDAVLKQYSDLRTRDINSMALITDGLARLFSNPLLSITLARNAGLIAADLLPGVRHQIARHAMGVIGRLPRLARGVPFE